MISRAQKSKPAVDAEAGPVVTLTEQLSAVTRHLEAAEENLSLRSLRALHEVRAALALLPGLREEVPELERSRDSYAEEADAFADKVKEQSARVAELEAALRGVYTISNKILTRRRSEYLGDRQDVQQIATLSKSALQPRTAEALMTYRAEPRVIIEPRSPRPANSTAGSSPPAPEEKD